MDFTQGALLVQSIQLLCITITYYYVLVHTEGAQYIAPPGDIQSNPVRPSTKWTPLIAFGVTSD